MNALRRLYWGETKIDFIGRARTWFAISAVLIVVSLVALVWRGLSFSLEFTGGTSWVVTADDFDTAAAEEAIQPFDLGADTKVQAVGDTAVRIETHEVTPDQANEVSVALAEAAGVPVDQVSKESTGPSWGGAVSRKAIQALVMFLALAVIYISLRFEFKMAITAIAELVHDIIVIVGIYALLGLAVSPATIIAILTMLGYSLYDAVVVFDKVRENEPLLAAGRYTYSEMVNRSMNQVLSRSVATSVTSFLPAASLLLLGSVFLGATTLEDLSLALVVGIASGTYSSIFFASPILAHWKEREPRYRTAKAKAKAKVPGPSPARGTTRKVGVKQAVPARTGADAGGSTTPEETADDTEVDAAAEQQAETATKTGPQAAKARKHGRQTSTSRKKR